MAKQTPWDQGFRRIRQLLSGLLRDCAESREPVAEILEILDRLADNLDEISESSDTSFKQGPERPYRRNRPKTYRIVRRKNRLCLAEHTEGSKQEFICPEDVYEVLAAELAEISEPVHFEGLTAGVAKRLGRTLPEYPVRLCIRFWLNCDPPLIEKVRTRYRSTQPQHHVRATRKAWRKLPQLDDE